MTASKLIEALKDLDPTTLVSIDTLGFHHGLFPAADIVDGKET